MTDIKQLPKDELNSELQKIAAKYKAVALDAEQRSKNKSFLKYLQDKKVKVPGKEQKRVAIHVHESIRRQFREQTMVQFLIMEKNNDYGQMGEQRVSISFCRNVLNIPPSREVTQEDADIFRNEVDNFEKESGLSVIKSLVEKELLFHLDILGDRYDLTDKQQEINEVLEFLGVPYRLFVGNIKGKITFIYGSLEEKNISGKDIVILGKEVVRSPQYVLSIAAGQGSVGIFIRKESCETIFYNKWVSFFDMSKVERQIYQAHAYSGIREGLKEQALKFYKVKSRAELEKIKEVFIQEMIEGIFYHEIGHEIGEEGNIPDEEDNIAGARGIVGDDVVVVLKEAIADWAPPKGKQSGPVWAFLHKGKKDHDKAMRLFYVYLSDNWFIDSDDEFMGIQTDILCALLLSFIQNNGMVDFQALEKEFEGVFKFVVQKYIAILSKVNKILRSAHYMAGIHRINFDALEKELFKVYAKQDPSLKIEKLRKKLGFWQHLFGLVKSFSPETHEKIEKFIQDSGKEVKLAILDKVSRGAADRYNNSLREYVTKKMQEVGVFKQKETPKADLVLKPIVKALKIPPALEKKVKKQFDNVLNDEESLDIAISYEGKPDPLWAIIQELLIRSGFGNIRSGMAIGEDMEPGDTKEVKRKKAIEALESMRDQVESEMYMDIKLLRVNSKYLNKTEFEPILDEVKLFDGTGLRKHIPSIQYIDIKDKRVMEAYIPLKRGYVDWNTSQAIWRINQELRPKDYLKQWTVDKVFMESLLERYMAAQ